MRPYRAETLAPYLFVWNYPRTPGFERVSCRAPAFGLRQLAGAFARGTVESGAAWLALGEKSGDKSPQSKRCRACETACRMPVPHVRYRLNTYIRTGAASIPNGSFATHKTEEPGGNPVLSGQLIADQPHPGKPGDPIEAVIA